MERPCCHCVDFGCPVRKVPRLGGGSALPYKRRLFANIVREMVVDRLAAW